jgi:excisionase family DNA binding protein
MPTQKQYLLHKQIEPHYSTSCIAHILKVSRVTVFRYIKEGKLKAIKQGRNYQITESSYHSFVFDHRLNKERQEEIKKHLMELVLLVRAEILQMHPSDRPDISRIISRD